MNSLLLWVALFLVMLADHELAHVALQHAAEPTSTLTGAMFLGTATGETKECSEALACVTFHRTTRPTEHYLLDIMNKLFLACMVAYPVSCKGYFSLVKPSLMAEGEG